MYQAASAIHLPAHWRIQLTITTLARVLFNISIRMIYPFMPEFSRALQVPEQTLMLVTSARFALSTTSPLFAGLPDRFGARNVMLFALLLFFAALVLAIVLPGFATFTVLLFTASTAKNIYDPAAYSFWSERTDYARRGFVLALYETSWSISFLFGMPLVGWLMARNLANAWQFPFWFMGSACLVAIVVLARAIQSPAAHPHQHNAHAPTWQRWRVVFQERRVHYGLVLGFLVSVANESVLVILGVWLEKSYGLSLAALGFASFVIGAAELLGEGGVMAWVDRLGKQRAVAYGLISSALAFVLLQALAVNTSGALAGLFLLFLTYEFTIVATLPLMSELVPSARAQTMSLNMTVLLLGRMVGALLGGVLFQNGLIWNIVMGASLNLAALAVLQIGLRRGSD